MFDIGKEYKRKEEIHNIYGGQTRGGISTPKDKPFIFIFTSDTGELYGYHDEFHDGIFWYTGEGQTGDMQMSSGNKAISEHKKNGKIIHLFEYTRRAYVRYLGQAECLGFHTEFRNDAEGTPRAVFIFHLDINPIADNSSDHEPNSVQIDLNTKNLGKKSLNELRKAALTPSPSHGTEQLRTSISRYRSTALKSYVIMRSDGICEGCGNKAPFFSSKGPYLECHHVERLSDGGPDFPENVVAVCPNCHRRAHYSTDNTDFNSQLKLRALEAESKFDTTN